MRNKNIYAHLSVLSANLIYGGNYTIAKEVMPEFIKPFGFILIRVVVTAVLFMLLSLISGNEKVERKDLLRLLLCAMFGVAINQLLFFKGLDMTFPINASLMMTTNPILVLIIAAILAREKITILKSLGILIGIAGATVLLLPGNIIQFNATTAMGDFFILLNSLSFGIFLIIVRPMMQKYRTITVMKWIFLFGSMMVIPFGWNEFNEINWSAFDYHIWLSVTYVVIGTTSVAYMLNTYALKNLTSSSVSVYIYLQPLFATFVAIVLGRDSLNKVHLLAAALIFCGVYLVTSVKPGSRLKMLMSLKKN